MSYVNNQHKYNRNRNNYYNYTSIAHDYEQEYDYNHKNLNRRVKKIKKDKYILVEQGIKFFSLKFYVTLIVLVTFIVSIIFIEALIIQKKFEIDNLSVTLKEITENNKNLETELAKNLDLEYVEYIASTELDMQKPASHQIVHINVPKESYSEKSYTEDKQTLLTKLTNFFKNIKY